MKNYTNVCRDYLLSLVCDWDGNIPMVCCPSDGHLSANTIPPELDCSHDNDNSKNCCPFKSSRTETILPAWPKGRLLAPFCGISTFKGQYIVNGTRADSGSWPWMALLGYSSASGETEWNCGGSLISQRHVLTAAHCVYQQNNLQLVRLGERNFDDRSIDGGTRHIDFQIEKTTIHPEFNTETYSSDIAVIKLERDIDITGFIRPICLPTPEMKNENLTNTKPYIAGWGATMYHGLGSKYLLQQQLPVLENEQCRAAYSGFKVLIDYRVICAGYMEGGTGICDGDSGGPLMSPWTVNDLEAFYAVGVISYSYRCAYAGYPDVFMKVTEFLDFILQQLN